MNILEKKTQNIRDKKQNQNLSTVYKEMWAKQDKLCSLRVNNWKQIDLLGWKEHTKKFHRFCKMQDN